jgi:hypothetical protein
MLCTGCLQRHTSIGAMPGCMMSLLSDMCIQAVCGHTPPDTTIHDSIILCMSAWDHTLRSRHNYQCPINHAHAQWTVLCIWIVIFGTPAHSSTVWNMREPLLHMGKHQPSKFCPLPNLANQIASWTVWILVHEMNGLHKHPGTSCDPMHAAGWY